MSVKSPWSLFNIRKEKDDRYVRKRENKAKQQGIARSRKYIYMHVQTRLVIGITKTDEEFTEHLQYTAQFGSTTNVGAACVPHI